MLPVKNEKIKKNIQKYTAFSEHEINFEFLGQKKVPDSLSQFLGKNLRSMADRSDLSL